MISEQHRFIFVHIEKTGGTSIEKVFQWNADIINVPLKHPDIAFYKTSFPQQFETYFKFSFVRNPWDWLVSRYFWSRDWQNLLDYSFAEFLHRLRDGVQLSAAGPWLEHALRPQVSRVCIDGNVAVDFIGRFETLHSDFETVCNRIGLADVPLPWVFNTGHDIYTEYYDRELEEIVRSLYAVDIEAFGYEFGR